MHPFNRFSCVRLESGFASQTMDNARYNGLDTIFSFISFIHAEPKTIAKVTISSIFIDFTNYSKRSKLALATMMASHAYARHWRRHRYGNKNSQREIHIFIVRKLLIEFHCHQIRAHRLRHYHFRGTVYVCACANERVCVYSASMKFQLSFEWSKIIHALDTYTYWHSPLLGRCSVRRHACPIPRLHFLYHKNRWLCVLATEYPPYLSTSTQYTHTTYRTQNTIIKFVSASALARPCELHRVHFFSYSVTDHSNHLICVVRIKLTWIVCLCCVAAERETIATMNKKRDCASWTRHDKRACKSSAMTAKTTK